MQLTKSYRPQKITEMAGQELAKKILQAIIKDPENSPSTLLFCGAFGTGKTTSARALAYALNPKFSGSLDLVYTEYDCSMASVDKIRTIKDNFYSAGGFWSVIVFDECHLLSAAAQSALLKVVEEAPPKCKIIFATTDPEKVLNTIRSRSLEIRFETVPFNDVVNNLKYVSTKAGIDIDDNTIAIIAKRSKGHMRNAHMLLDKYVLIGKEAFITSVKTSHNSILQYFVALVQGNKEKLFSSIDEILSFPLAEIEEDFKEVISDIMAAIVGSTEVQLPYQQFAKVVGIKFLPVIQKMLEDWFINSFKNDQTLRCALLVIYQMVHKN